MRLALYCIKHVSRYARNVLYDCAMLLGSTSTQDQARLRSLGLRRRSWSTTPGSRSCCTRAARRPATRTSLWRARRRSFLKLWRRTEWFDFFCLSDSVFFFFICVRLCQLAVWLPRFRSRLTIPVPLCVTFCLLSCGSACITSPLIA